MARPEDLPEWATGADAEIVAPSIRSYFKRVDSNQFLSNGLTIGSTTFKWLEWFTQRAANHFRRGNCRRISRNT